MTGPSRTRTDDRGPVATLSSPSDPSDGTKLLLVDFRSGEAVSQHPSICPLLSEGWVITSAVPRIVEGEGLRLLVVLKQGTATPGVV